MRTDDEYLNCDPFQGDRDVKIECHKKKIVVTKKAHWCAASSLVPPYETHDVPAGVRAVRETAKVDGDFGSCYLCLPCLDACLRFYENNGEWDDSNT